MKITDPEVIKNGEKDLIASVQEDLDPGTIKEILKKRLSMATLESQGGRIVVHENQVAFQLDFQVNINGSLLFDRNGNLIEDAQAVAEPSEPATSDLDEPEKALDPVEKQTLQEDIDEEDILEDLQDIAPAQELEGEDADILDPGITDDLSIDLPDYDLEDDDLDDADLDDADLDDADLADTLDTEEEKASKEDLDINLAAALDAESLEEDDTSADTAGTEIDTGDLDDDINDLLKESREFWAQKKNS